MKSFTVRRRFWLAATLLAVVVFASACDTAGETPFGEPCETGADCVSGFCVGGESGGERAPFCSDDCSGRKTGDSCGDGRGRCVANFVSWCWMPCETNAECAATNPERPECAFLSSNGMADPFKVCIGKSGN